MKRLRAAGMAAVLVVTGALVSVAVASPAQAAPVICEKFGSTSIQSGSYIVQNNVWGADTAQCIDVNQNGGFTITQAEHNKATNGAPAAYPSIYAGCHYTNCTSGPMPIQLTQVSSASSSIGVTYPGSGTWNAAYDIWLDPTARTNGQNGMELMIWLNRQGSIQPIGSPIGTVNLAGSSWEVWYGNTGWHVVSYLRTSATTSLSFDARTFIDDVISRGYIDNSWYLTSIQAGFEPWVGGAGLAVTSFSAQVNSGPPPPPPSSPPPPPPPSSEPPPPPPPGGCTATGSTQSQWPQGYVSEVTVTNTGGATISGWTVTFSLPSGHQIVNSWNAQLSGSTATNLSYNGNLGPGQSTSFGFQASRPGGSQLPSGFTCSAS
jgi:hypothetical protein